MSFSETTTRELLLAAGLMARPELVKVLYPPVRFENGKRPRAGYEGIRSLEAKAIISILATQGETFATPANMLAALEDTIEEVEPDAINYVLATIPDPEEVTAEKLFSLRDAINRDYERTKLADKLERAANALKNDEETSDVLEYVGSSLTEFSTGGTGDFGGVDNILGDLETDAIGRRWKIGCSFLDDQMVGMDGEGNETTGQSGRGEITTISALYGTGKTRWLFNIMAGLLDQPDTSLDVILLEDNRARYAAKLMGVRFDIEAYKVGYFAANKLDYLRESEKEVCSAALAWFRSKKGNIRIHDGNKSKTNIYRFPSAIGLLDECYAVNGTTHCFVDHASAWKGDLTTLETYVQRLQEYANRNQVSSYILTQVSNETAKYGNTPGMVPAKGTGDWGAIAHWAYFLTVDPNVGQAEMRIQQEKGRDAGRTEVYAELNVSTGKIVRYKGTPDYMKIPVPGEGRGGSRKKG